MSVARSPRLLKRTAMAGYEPTSLDLAPDGGLLATTQAAGIHVFAPR